MYSDLDAYARPSPKIQGFYKQYQKQNFDSSDLSLNFDAPNIATSFKPVHDLDVGRLNVAFQKFTGKFEDNYFHTELPVPVFESIAIPGRYL